MYSDRKFMIFNVSELNQIDFSQVLERPQKIRLENLLMEQKLLLSGNPKQYHQVCRI